MTKKTTIPNFLSGMATCSSILCLLFIVLVGVVSRVQAASPRQDIANGEVIFNAKCVTCHTIGKGKLVGPDLKGVTGRRDSAWLGTWIKAPDKVLGAGDPVAVKLLLEYNNIPMPNLGLSDADVANLIAYFQSVDSAASAVPASTQAVGAQQSPVTQPTFQPLTGAAEVLALNGDPDYGEKFFTGAAPLKNAGTPCIACHSVEGVGIVGGGSLGPDQTHVYTKYSRQGLAAALGALPFPTMQGVFASKPLTTIEQADLLAFFERADKQSLPHTLLNFQIIYGAGSAMTVVFFASMYFFWPRQRMSLAERLRKNGKL